MMRALLGLIGILLLVAGIAWGPISVSSRVRDGLPNQFDRLVPNLPTAPPRAQITEREIGRAHV